MKNVVEVSIGLGDGFGRLLVKWQDVEKLGKKLRDENQFFWEKWYPLCFPC